MISSCAFLKLNRWSLDSNTASFRDLSNFNFPFFFFCFPLNKYFCVRTKNRRRRWRGFSHRILRAMFIFGQFLANERNKNEKLAIFFHLIIYKKISEVYLFICCCFVFFKNNYLRSVPREDHNKRILFQNRSLSGDDIHR